MNNYELADFLVQNISEEMNFYKKSKDIGYEIYDPIKGPIKGGKSLDKNDNDKNNDKNDKKISKMEKYEAIITRPILSKFEYVGCITSLANYLKSLKSINRYTEAIDCGLLVNPSELAFRLLDQGKMDVIIIRNRIEKVTFSKLYKNPLWREEIINYFDEKNKSMKKEFYDPICEITKEDQE